MRKRIYKVTISKGYTVVRFYRGVDASSSSTKCNAIRVKPERGKNIASLLGTPKRINKNGLRVWEHADYPTNGKRKNTGRKKGGDWDGTGNYEPVKQVICSVNTVVSDFIRGDGSRGEKRRNVELAVKWATTQIDTFSLKSDGYDPSGNKPIVMSLKPNVIAWLNGGKKHGERSVRLHNVVTGFLAK